MDKYFCTCEQKELPYGLLCRCIHVKKIGPEPSDDAAIREWWVLSEEAWRMLPDECKEIMKELKEKYIESLMEDIKAVIHPLQQENERLSNCLNALDSHIDDIEEQNTRLQSQLIQLREENERLNKLVNNMSR